MIKSPTFWIVMFVVMFGGECTASFSGHACWLNPICLPIFAGISTRVLLTLVESPFFHHKISAKTWPKHRRRTNGRHVIHTTSRCGGEREELRLWASHSQWKKRMMIILIACSSQIDPHGCVNSRSNIVNDPKFDTRIPIQIALVSPKSWSSSTQGLHPAFPAAALPRFRVLHPTLAAVPVVELADGTHFQHGEVLQHHLLLRPTLWKCVLRRGLHRGWDFTPGFFYRNLGSVHSQLTPEWLRKWFVLDPDPWKVWDIYDMAAVDHGQFWINWHPFPQGPSFRRLGRPCWVTKHSLHLVGIFLVLQFHQSPLLFCCNISPCLPTSNMFAVPLWGTSPQTHKCHINLLVNLKRKPYYIMNPSISSPGRQAHSPIMFHPVKNPQKSGVGKCPNGTSPYYLQQIFGLVMFKIPNYWDIYQPLEIHKNRPLALGGKTPRTGLASMFRSSTPKLRGTWAAPSVPPSMDQPQAEQLGTTAGDGKSGQK